MAVMNSSLHSVSPNRRRRVRHKIQTPAYATFTEQSQASTLDLHEIVDISEDGIALQCHAPLEVRTQLNLCLDLADCPQQIYTTGKVIWSNSSGRAGLRFSELPPESLSRLRQWLFLNVMSGVVHGETQLGTFVADGPPLPNYSDTLAAVTAVQRQVEALGSDLASTLRLVAERAQSLVRASGAAIALTEEDPDFLVCRASSGPDAPPVGARLQIGSGFSGECVKTGTLLRCDDTEIDSLVDRESCRGLGIRSMLAVPLRAGEKSIGILEVFSGQANRFSDADERVLQRLAQSILAAVNRTARVENLPPLQPASAETNFAPRPGSVLFASVSEPEEKVLIAEEKVSSGISLPRSHLFLLICAAAAIAMVLGYNLAPLIQTKLEQRARAPLPTVLASSQPPKSDPAPPTTPAMEAASFELMRQLAQDGDPVAEYALGLRYFQGDEKNALARDEKQAFRWFSRAAEHGNLAAQAKLGFLYWGGRGVPKDLNQAYFWTVLARARGDQENKDLAAVLASGMTRSQAAAIEQQADLWLQQHMRKKPAAGRPSGQLRTSVVPPAIK
ncbi:MAG TPA: GAF domain-containing protein [Candidatus Sulfotelmatobacter sp.]|jgi:putative methionine-R-sulfoxide reductase with GAF domain|nr:GAF domain-containing protein [Candidatus Sulfotelmatobacter sp.]